VLQSARVKEYVWAAGFLAIAVTFSPLPLAVKIFLFMGLACIVTVASLVAAFRPQPIAGISSHAFGNEETHVVMSTLPVGHPFRGGDEVVLTAGTYPGTQGIFLRLKEDTHWADVRERDGRIRSHPLAWLAHSSGAVPNVAH